MWSLSKSPISLTSLAQTARIPNSAPLDALGSTQRPRKISITEAEYFSNITGNGPPSVHTISAWLKNFIIYTHERVNIVVHPRGHDLKKVATSLAFYKSFTLNDILKAGKWSNHSTFSGYYLHDARDQLDNKFRLASILPGFESNTEKTRKRKLNKGNKLLSLLTSA